MRTKAKITSSLAIGIIVATILVATLSFYFRRSNTSSLTPRPTLTVESNSADLVTDEAIQNERNAIDLMKNNIQILLSQKNEWEMDDFTLILTHIDSEMVAGDIVPNDTQVPKGLFLAKHVGQSNYEIIFDSSTPSPCSLLEENVVYPQSINDMCRR